MDKSKILNDEQIEQHAWVVANELLGEATSGCTSKEQMNNQIDILRNAAVNILAIDLANARHQLKWDDARTAKHIERLGGRMLARSQVMIERIEAGLTSFNKTETPQ